MADSELVSPPIRVVLQHFALPQYRIPVFRELARTDDLQLEVVYGTAPGLTNAAPDGFVARSARVRRIRTPLGRFSWDSAQWRSAGRGRCDVLIMTWNVRSVSLIPALMRARFNGVRTLIWGHGYSRRDSLVRRAFRRCAARLADGVIFYDREEAERYEAATQRRGATFVALNSLDQGPIQAARRRWLSDDEALARFRVDNDIDGRPTVLFVSRFKPENRIEVLFEAAGRLRENHPDLRLVIIGEGFVERPEVRRVVDGLGIGEVVRFLGPIYDEERLAPWFLSADVFCYPSNLGLSALHAFGYGLPVVTGDSERHNPPEWRSVRPGGNGLHFKSGDPDSLAAAVDEILADPGLRARLGAEALRTVTELHTIETMVKGLRDAIRWAAIR
jgi:glycosyltransferase involved in cell wall biosynthesis